MPMDLAEPTLSASSPATGRRCPHRPCCPGPYAPDSLSARVLSACAEQGWSLLCNAVILFADGGAIRPDDTAVSPHRSSRLGNSS